MIKAVIFRNDENIQAFEISGHAKSGPYGYDLVCAGVSAVTFGAVNAAFKMSGMKLDIIQGGKGGYLSVRIPKGASPQQVEKMQFVFEVMLISLQTIEREYNQFIQIEEVSSSC